MPQKLIYVEGVGDIAFYKRKGTSSVKIRINGSDVRVTLPTWMPYRAAVLYVTQKGQWINDNRKEVAEFYDGVLIGKQHILKLEHTTGSRYNSKVTSNSLTVRIPESIPIDSLEAQQKIVTYAQKVLQVEAEELILPRVRNYATQHNFDVNTIEIKNLKSRWGSCSSKHDLAFSLFLIQLPWECIDYVMYHELAHTVHLNHSREFWSLLQSYIPNYKQIRRTMKQYSPHVVVAA